MRESWIGSRLRGKHWAPISAGRLPSSPAKATSHDLWRRISVESAGIRLDLHLDRAYRGPYSGNSVMWICNWKFPTLVFASWRHPLDAGSGIQGLVATRTDVRLLIMLTFQCSIVSRFSYCPLPFKQNVCCPTDRRQTWTPWRCRTAWIGMPKPQSWSCRLTIRITPAIYQALWNPDRHPGYSHKSKRSCLPGVRQSQSFLAKLLYIGTSTATSYLSPSSCGASVLRRFTLPYFNSESASLEDSTSLIIMPFIGRSFLRELLYRAMNWMTGSDLARQWTIVCDKVLRQ